MTYPQVHTPDPRWAALWLLSHPAAERAERAIRSTRTSAYFQKWDRFTAGVGAALGVVPAVTPFLGATLGAGLDLFFDRGLEVGHGSPLAASHLRFLGHRVRRWSDPKRALAWHIAHDERREAGDKEPPTDGVTALDDAVAAVLGLTTLGGITGDVGGGWLPLWREWTERTVAAQVASCGFDGSTRPALRGNAAETLAPYLELAGATDMAALGIAALVGFAPQRDSLLSPVRAVLPDLSRLIRLAADMAFDATEPVNCCIYLAAAERQLSVEQAQRELAEQRNRAVAVEKTLVALTRRDLDRFLITCSRSTPAIAKLGRAVEAAVVAEIRLVQSQH